MNEIDLEIKEANDMKLDGEAMKRLMLNRDFKRVFLSNERGLLKAGALELVTLMSQPGIPKEMVEANDKRLYAISFLTSYLDNLIELGNDAATSLANDEGEV